MTSHVCVSAGGLPTLLWVSPRQPHMSTVVGWKSTSRHTHVEIPRVTVDTIDTVGSVHHFQPHYVQISHTRGDTIDSSVVGSPPADTHTSRYLHVVGRSTSNHTHGDTIDSRWLEVHQQTHTRGDIIDSVCVGSGPADTHTWKYHRQCVCWKWTSRHTHVEISSTVCVLCVCVCVEICRQ